MTGTMISTATIQDQESRRVIDAVKMAILTENRVRGIPSTANVQDPETRRVLESVVHAWRLHSPSVILSTVNIQDLETKRVLDSIITKLKGE